MPYRSGQDIIPRYVDIRGVHQADTIPIGDGIESWEVPNDFDGYVLRMAYCRVDQPSTNTAAVTLQIHNTMTGHDLLAIPVTVDCEHISSRTASTQAEVDASFAAISAGDVLRFDVDTADDALGLVIRLKVQKPHVQGVAL